jgi:hypothetical protein
MFMTYLELAHELKDVLARYRPIAELPDPAAEKRRKQIRDCMAKLRARRKAQGLDGNGKRLSGRYYTGLSAIQIGKARYTREYRKLKRTL